MVVPFGNGLILGYLMYRSGLVPRRLAWLGMIGGPLLLFGNVGVLFDLWDQTGAVNVLVVPEFLWELVLSFYPLIWGFRRVPIVEEYDRDHGVALKAMPEPVRVRRGSSHRGVRSQGRPWRPWEL